MTWQIVEGDCVEAMRQMAPASVDAVVCDPPYGLGFMGKEWDTIGDTGRGARARTERAAEVTPNGQGHSTSGGPYLAAGVDSLRSAGAPYQRWCEVWAREALRVLKPGGHLLAFGGTRTYHRLACAIEDAGFEVRDCLAWLYGSGFPKSLDVSKAIDRAAGAEREVVGRETTRFTATGRNQRYGKLDGFEVDADGYEVRETTAPATPDAERWQGWGTALKPAHEPIVMARKPLAGTVAGNVLAHGTGALNVDGCRIGTGKEVPASPSGVGSYGGNPNGQDEAATGMNPNVGRWPANVLLDPEAAALLDAQTGDLGQSHGARVSDSGMFAMRAQADVDTGYGDSGGASRFLYVAGPDPEEPCHRSEPASTAAPSSSPRSKPGDSAQSDAATPALDGDSSDPTRSAHGHPSTSAPNSPTPIRSLADAGHQDGTGITSNTTIPPSSSGCASPATTPSIPASATDGDTDLSASRLLYQAKASSAERNAGLEGFEAKAPAFGSATGDGLGRGISNTRQDWPRANVHPTVKPIELMRWLVRLVTPPRGLVLDPFAGSGTTGIAAVLEGFRFTGCEREPEYAAIARARIEWWSHHPDGLEIVAALQADRERRVVADSGQLDIFGALGAEPPPTVAPEGNGRAGEASAETRYTDRGSSDFAMKPGRRRSD